MNTPNKKPLILYEDDSVLILDKPSGWVVNEAKTTKNTPIVQRWLAESFNYPLTKDHLRRAGIVHRLDKETSGVLLVAKNKESFEDLQSQFKNREIGKIYQALVHGRVDLKKGMIEAPVGRLPWRRERFGILPFGRSATTRYKLIRYYTREKAYYSFLNLFPKTGRTHQLRVHLKYIGHPIVSDEFYAGRKTARFDRLWCERLFLHACEIAFVHPRDETALTITSPLPIDLKNALKALKVFTPLNS